MQTLAREVTYHPTLTQLLYYPLEEQASLRRGVLGTARDEDVVVGRGLTLGPWEHGNQSDVVLRVAVPEQAATLYVSVSAAVRIEFYVDFPGKAAGTAPWHEAEVGMLTQDPYASIKDTLRLLDDDRVLELRLLLDHTIAEAYWQGGRVAMTVPSPLEPSTSIALRTDTAGARVRVQSVTAWQMGSAWISREEALERASPREKVGSAGRPAASSTT